MLHDVFSICGSSGTVIGWATVSIDIGEQKRAERALSASRHELRALAGRLINAEEEARKRISRELHDDLGQKLAILAFDCGSLLLDNTLSVDQIRQEVRNIETRVVQISQDVRQIAHQLHPSILEDLGITAALRELCDEFSAREGIEAIFNEDHIGKDLPVSIASCLYRVAQEALHNVSKHAKAASVCVRLTEIADCVQLTIHDSGIGFDTNSESFRSGLGIVSMKERVRLVQGEFSIHSEPGRGTEVSVSVPFVQETL
jgi:signal transduction histidine kinase